MTNVEKEEPETEVPEILDKYQSADFYQLALEANSRAKAIGFMLEELKFVTERMEQEFAKLARDRGATDPETSRIPESSRNPSISDYYMDMFKFHQIPVPCINDHEKPDSIEFKLNEYESKVRPLKIPDADITNCIASQLKPPMKNIIDREIENFAAIRVPFTMLDLKRALRCYAEFRLKAFCPILENLRNFKQMGTLIEYVQEYDLMVPRTRPGFHQPSVVDCFEHGLCEEFKTYLRSQNVSLRLCKSYPEARDLALEMDRFRQAQNGPIPAFDPSCFQ